MTASLPLYAKVKDHIVTHIRSGAWEPGCRVPSENELVDSFGISRMTANRALRELLAEGFVDRVPGVGTFVKDAAPPRSSLVELRNIAEEIEARGHRYSCRLISLETIQANPAMAGDFEAGDGTELFHAVIVHEENGVPVQIEDRHVNAALVPDFMDQDFNATTPTAHLLRAVPVDELEHTVEAALPTPEQQRLLHVPAFEPCLRLHRRSWSKDQVVTVATFTYPASRYALYSRYKTSARGTLTE